MNTDYLQRLADQGLKNKDLAAAIVWRKSREGSVPIKLREVLEEYEVHGFAAQNPTRIRRALNADRRIIKAADGGYKVSSRHLRNLESEFVGHLGPQLPAAVPDTVLPAKLFESTRGYLEKVVAQINLSYSLGMFDCCAVMSRRLVETLIIESYESCGIPEEIKAPDGSYLMLSGLLAQLKRSNSLGLSRSALPALDAIKRLGDLSAHKRRFSARQSDIDRMRDGLRVVAEELLHVAKLVV